MSRTVGELNVDSREIEQCAARSVKKSSRQEVGTVENSFDRNPTLSVIIAITPMAKGSDAEEAAKEMSVDDQTSCSKKLAMLLNHQHNSTKPVMKTKKRHPCSWFSLCCGRGRLVRHRLHSKADGVPEQGDPFIPEPGVVRPGTPEVVRWDFDVFDYEERYPGHCLEVLFLELLKHFKLMSPLKLDPDICREYIKDIEAGYKNNPYHNHVHAADVLQSVGVILHYENYFQNFTSLELLALILSAAVHDVCHPGVNNDFHKKTRSALAKQFENSIDNSINERMHFTQAYNILESDNSKNMLKGLSEEEFSLMKRYVLEILLATDMDRHDALVRDFGKRFSQMNGSTIQGLSYPDKVLLLQMIVHCADISNPTRPWMMCREWAVLITEENIRQSEQAKKLNVNVSPSFDRKKVSLAKSQQFFLQTFVMPCFKTFGYVVPSFARMTLELAESNNQKWDEELANELSHEGALLFSKLMRQ